MNLKGLRPRGRKAASIQQHVEDLGGVCPFISKFFEPEHSDLEHMCNHGPLGKQMLTFKKRKQHTLL